ncbi:MAG: 2-dehydropantoate 2-reductase [Lachnospiraceae bacterium]|nr:2-dehydropantoate 2-reductase [Lachnospiraceae bacterium]
MRIAILGPGAMGLLFGAYLSKEHEVTLYGRSEENMERIRQEGVLVTEKDGTENVYRPDARTASSGSVPADLVVLFTKAGASETALESHKALIGPETVLMTLQNGAGHEALLKRYAKEEMIMLGTTQEGSFRADPRHILHSGAGVTAMGPVTGCAERFQAVADAFSGCGFETVLSGSVQYMIWNKLMINASSSVLTAVFQMPQGYIYENKDAWELCKRLIREICAVAEADGYHFDEEEQIARLEKHLTTQGAGRPSISVDIKNHQRTEVNVINGSVLAAAHRLGVPVPTHEIIVRVVKGLEARDPEAII